MLEAQLITKLTASKSAVGLSVLIPCGFLITSFNKSTFELDLMFFTFSLKVQILVCVYPLRIYLVYDLLVEVSGALPPQLV